MAEQESLWDVDVAGPGTRSRWDVDVAGPGTESRWDLISGVISAVLRAASMAAGHIARSLPGRHSARG